MKLVRFGPPGQERPGVWIDGPEPEILDVRAMAYDIDDYTPHVLTHWGLERVRGLLAEPGRKTVRAAGVRLGPPVPPPRNLVCVGKNYAAHAKEFDTQIPDAPILFAKSPGTLVGPHDAIRIPPGASEIDAEAELGVVIGRPLRNAGDVEAMQAIAGYLAINDVTDRAAQRAAGQWFRGKSFETFCPAGPWLVTPDALPDPQRLRVRSMLDGSPLQDGNTRDMLFPIAALVAYVSRTFELQPGDVLATGTPDGVGFARTPPVFLRAGSLIEIHIEGIGSLRNPVVAA